jgi:hypothetical protein
MSAALRAFEQILSVIYDGFEAVSHTLPPVTNLAALVEQLAALPTKACLLDADRLGKGTHYVRAGMQNWAFQICYHQLLAVKCRNTFPNRLTSQVVCGNPVRTVRERRPRASLTPL